MNKSFVAIDLCDCSRFGNLPLLFDQDVFILNYLISELSGAEDKFKKVLEQIVKGAPSGSLFLIIDRNEQRFQSSVQRLCKGAGLKIVEEKESATNMDSDEESSVLATYRKAIGRGPRLTWKAFWALAKKK